MAFRNSGCSTARNGRFEDIKKNYQLLSPGCLGEYRNVLSIRGLCILSVCTFSLENHQLTTSNCDKSA